MHCAPCACLFKLSIIYLFLSLFLCVSHPGSGSARHRLQWQPCPRPASLSFLAGSGDVARFSGCVETKRLRRAKPGLQEPFQWRSAAARAALSTSLTSCERGERGEREREREREDLMEANQNTDRDARFVCASAQPEELAAGHLPRNASWKGEEKRQRRECVWCLIVCVLWDLFHKRATVLFCLFLMRVPTCDPCWRKKQNKQRMVLTKTGWKTNLTRVSVPARHRLLSPVLLS